MDLRAYYKKVREAEQTITGDTAVLVSLATPEGGKPGVFTETSRNLAAKMIAEGRSRLATEDEANAFQQRLSDALHAYEDAEAAKRLQVMVVPSPEFKKRERS